MRISKSLWYIAICLLVVLTSCDDDKKIERRIEEQKKEAKQAEERKKQEEEEERKKKEEEEKRAEEERKKREEEERKQKEEGAKLKFLEGVYSGTRRYPNKSYASNENEIFNVSISWSQESKKLEVFFSSALTTKSAALISQEKDKVIFYGTWKENSGGDCTATVLFTPSKKSMKITTICRYSDYNWTFEGKKQ